MDLKGKVAIVTGGAVRVGRALTLALAEAGCHVFIHYGRSAGPAEATRSAAEQFGVQAHIYAANLGDLDSTQSVVPAAVARFGQVDILINSAAIFPEDDSFASSDADLWETLFNINLRAPFLLSQAFAAQVSEQGKIVNILDARIRQAAPDHFVYRLTKSGLATMTTQMAHALAPTITVNAVALGAILPPPGQGDDYLQAIADERVPLRRHGNAGMVAANVLHLLRQDFLTGVTIPIDGGEFL